MLVGLALGRRYDRADVVSVALMTAGVVLYSASKIAPVWSAIPGGSAAESAIASSTLRNTLGGLALLMLNLLADAVVTNGQDSLYHGSRVTPFQMMWLLNGASACYLFGYLALDRLWRGADSTLSQATGFAERHPTVIAHTLAFSACGAAAQLVIYVSVRSFGSFTTSFITISRKFATILLSVVIYNHSLSRAQWAGVALVFAGFVAQVAGKSHGASGALAASARKSQRLSQRESPAGGGGDAGRASSSATSGAPSPSSLRRRSGPRVPPLPLDAQDDARAEDFGTLRLEGAIGYSVSDMTPRRAEAAAATAATAAAASARVAIPSARRGMPLSQRKADVDARDAIPQDTMVDGGPTATARSPTTASSARLRRRLSSVRVPLDAPAVSVAGDLPACENPSRVAPESSRPYSARGGQSGVVAIASSSSMQGGPLKPSPQLRRLGSIASAVRNTAVDPDEQSQHQLPLGGAGGSLSPMLPLGHLSSDGIANGSPVATPQRAPSPLTLDDDGEHDASARVVGKARLFMKSE